MSEVYVKEIAVRERRGDEVGVRIEGDSIVVKWFCGDERVFTPAGLKDALDHVAALKRHADVWLRLKDRYEMAFQVRVDGDELHVEGSSFGVNWADLRKALRAQLKAVA